ncbi:hypothetical protein DA2_3613 [Desulfovibrio sp. A2]|nr:hypothetical protein DA2_3613 [Desulfovibrio sp. A2]
MGRNAVGHGDILSGRALSGRRANVSGVWKSGPHGHAARHDGPCT